MSSPTTQPSPGQSERLRRQRRPLTTGIAGSLICAVAVGALVIAHPQAAGALASNVTTADLLSIDHNGGAWLGGAGGVVVHRTPGGDVRDDLPAPVDVDAILSTSTGAVYAAGPHGSLYYQGAGSAWCRIQVPPAVFTENLHAIASLSDGSVVVVGTDGLVMELTGPAGCAATFIVDARVPGAAVLNAVQQFADGAVVAAGDAGTMIIGHVDSTVHHLVFSPVVTGTLADLYAVAPSASGMVTVGAAGAVLDGSFSVDPQSQLPTLVTQVLGGIPTVQSLHDAAMSAADGLLVAVGDAGTMLESADGGVTWTVMASGTVSGGNAKGYVDALYQTVLQRQPDSSGEAYWVQQLDRGAFLATVAASLINSFEVLEQRVAGYYLTYLARNASGDELAYWARALASGVRDEDVILGFVGSTEYLGRI